MFGGYLLLGMPRLQHVESVHLRRVSFSLKTGFSYLMCGGRRCGAALGLDAVQYRFLRLLFDLRLGVAALLPLLGLPYRESIGCLVSAGRCWIAAPKCAFGVDLLLAVPQRQGVKLVCLLGVSLPRKAESAYLMGGILRCGVALVCALGLVRLWSAACDCLLNAGWKSVVVLSFVGMVVCSPPDLDPESRRFLGCGW
jgi:hypothetical protein